MPRGTIKKIKNKNKYTVSVPHVQILLTGLEEGPKVEESQMTGTESKLFFLQGLKPESAQITGTKRGINPIQNT